MTKRTFWLQAAHLALALSLPVVLTLLMGCLKATAKQEDLGPEVGSDVINKILDKQTTSGDLSKLKVGQYLNFANTRRIETADIDTTLGSHRVDVIDWKKTGATTVFTVKITDEVRGAGTDFTKVVTQDSVSVNNTLTSSSSLAQSLHAQAATTRTSFHHLQESNGLIDAPDAVKARGCLGLTNCQIPVHNVHFDLVNWQDDGSYKKTTLDLSFSQSTPFMPFGSGMQQLTGVLLNDCRSTYVQVGDIPVYVRDCMTLDDYQN